MLTGVLQLNATPVSYVYVNQEVEECAIMATDQYSPYTHSYQKIQPHQYLVWSFYLILQVRHKKWIKSGPQDMVHTFIPFIFCHCVVFLWKDKILTVIL